jgi:glycosyltransferase involved in cell wall biosynthesis
MNLAFTKIAILIPSFNPNQKLVDLVISLSSIPWNKIIVVDDGSSQEFQVFFDRLKVINNLQLLTHSNNKGKGAAIKTGLRYIKEKSFTLDGLITVDSDGQHLTEDIIKIARSADSNQDSVIFGVRSFDESIPLRSKLGNKITKHLLYLLNGISIDDSQTGLRYLPISILSELLKLPGEKYEYELECLFVINKLGYKIIQVKIRTVYLDDNANSHFRPLKDSLRIYRVFAKFSISSFLSFVLDICIFTLFLFYLESILAATAIARILSGIFNFIFNRNFVFKANKKSEIIKESIGYILLWGALLIASGLIVSSQQGSSAYFIILFKIMVDFLLFLISFYVQNYIIFKK